MLTEKERKRILTKTTGKFANPPLPATTPKSRGPAELPISPNPIVRDITDDFKLGGTRAATIDRTRGVTGLKTKDEYE